MRAEERAQPIEEGGGTGGCDVVQGIRSFLSGKYPPCELEVLLRRRPLFISEVN